MRLVGHLLKQGSTQEENRVRRGHGWKKVEKHFASPVYLIDEVGEADKMDEETKEIGPAVLFK